MKSSQLCQSIIEILPPLFLGDTAHEALMQRSLDLLKYICKYKSLNQNLLMMLWDLGCHHNNTVVLQVIQDLIPTSFNLEILEILVDHIQSIQPSSVTAQIADILGAIGLRCRTILLEYPIDKEISMINNNSQSFIYYSHDEIFNNFIKDENNNGNNDNNDDSNNNNNNNTNNKEIVKDKEKVLRLHNIAVFTLFTWAEDGSTVDDTIAVKCVAKIDSIIDLGINGNIVVQAGSLFPWNEHWNRTYPILIRAIEKLQLNNSILVSIKTIRSILLSWVKEEDYLKVYPNVNVVQNYNHDNIPNDFSKIKI